MQIENFQQLENYLRNAGHFENLGVNKIDVFGSFARNEKFKDIDLLIEGNVPDEPLIDFKNVLEKDLEIPVDIILSKYAEPIILYRSKQDLKYASRQ
ncbi:MAG: nucleotidyltransferase domain-containing protein [Parafilimonas sp.]